MLCHMPKVTEQVGGRVRTSNKGGGGPGGGGAGAGELTTASSVQGVSLRADNGHPAPRLRGLLGLAVSQGTFHTAVRWRWRELGAGCSGTVL